MHAYTIMQKDRFHTKSKKNVDTFSQIYVDAFVLFGDMYISFSSFIKLCKWFK